MDTLPTTGEMVALFVDEATVGAAVAAPRRRRRHRGRERPDDDRDLRAARRRRRRDRRARPRRRRGAPPRRLDRRPLPARRADPRRRSPTRSSGVRLVPAAARSRLEHDRRASSDERADRRRATGAATCAAGALRRRLRHAARGRVHARSWRSARSRRCSGSADGTGPTRRATWVPSLRRGVRRAGAAGYWRWPPCTPAARTVDWAALGDAPRAAARCVDLPTYPWQRAPHWSPRARLDAGARVEPRCRRRRPAPQRHRPSRVRSTSNSRLVPAALAALDDLAGACDRRGSARARAVRRRRRAAHRRRAGRRRRVRPRLRAPRGALARPPRRRRAARARRRRVRRAGAAAGR